MKFKAYSEGIAKFRRKKIKTRLYESGFITLYEVKEMFMEKTEESDRDYVWSKNIVLENKIRVRQTKKGWFLYLPEPEKLSLTEEKEESKSLRIGDIRVINADSFMALIIAIENRFNRLEDLMDCSNGLRPCIVKAKKSGLKEERQDRNAKFHRWADLSKGVQQVVGIVEFDDGHVEQVRPDRIVFGEWQEEAE